jgi:hypothetical protein
VNTRRQFLLTAPLGLAGVAAACRVSTPESQPAGTTASGTATPGAPPAFGTAAAAGPEVTAATFAEAEKLVQTPLTPAERTVAAESWRRTMAPLVERRVGPRKVALPPELAPATRWDPQAASRLARPHRPLASCATRPIRVRCRRARTTSRSHP